MNQIFEPIFYFIISIISLSCSINFLKYYLNDVPNNRSSHRFSKPKGGGYIFVLSSIIFSILNKNIFLILSLPLAIIGLLDDKYNLSRKLRFSSQFLTVCLIIFFNGLPSYLEFLPSIFVFIFLTLLGVTLINFTNFMDGIDGLVAGCFLIMFIMYSLLIGNIYIPVVSSIFAFLLFNWPPSRIFMGDIGSTFLGSILFMAVIQSKGFEEMLAALLFSFPLMFDAFICLIRRFLNGKKIFNPHRDHLYQRLCDNDISH